MGDWDVKYLDKHDRATGTKTFRFERPADLEYTPGQYFFLSIPGADGNWLRHHFSFSSSPTERDIAFTTRMTGHEFKNRMDELPSATVVGVEAPYGDFVVKPDMAKVAFVCGGIGATPARSTIKWALDTSAPLDIVLLYGNHDRESAAFRDEFDEIRSERIRIANILSHPGPGWQGPKGLIDADFVRAQVADWRDRYFFVSGPPSMVKALAGMLSSEVGVTADHLISEDFTGYE